MGWFKYKSEVTLARKKTKGIIKLLSRVVRITQDVDLTAKTF